MARRRYGKSPAISTAGQSERPRDPQTVAEEFPVGSEPASPSAPAPDATPEPQHFSSGLKEQLATQQQYQQQHALHQYIAAHFPGALAHEAQWLIANPQHLSNPALVHQAAMIAAQRGIPRGSGEFLHFVGQLLDQHHAAMQAAPPPMPAAPAPPIPEPAPAPPAVTPMAHIDIETTEGPDEERMIAAHHVAAPVSRGEHSYSMSGDYEPSGASRITLTKAQREQRRRPVSMRLNTANSFCA